MNAIVTARAGTGSLAPQNFAEAVEFSRMLAKSGMVPKDYVGKPENVLVALQWGAEVGLGPLQALNGISIINGKPSLWGDAALALVRGHPACASIREGVDGEGDARHGWCEVTRRGEQPQRRTFSVADAKKAGLWSKSGPWQQYPERMLQLRARGFAIRDVFPDALRGVITAEEAHDMSVGEPLPPAAGPTIQGQAERAPPPADLIALNSKGMQVSFPDAESWLRYCRDKALYAMQSADAVRAWMKDMEQHIAEAPADAQERLHDAAAARVDALTPTMDHDAETGA